MRTDGDVYLDKRGAVIWMDGMSIGITEIEELHVAKECLRDLFRDSAFLSTKRIRAIYESAFSARKTCAFPRGNH